MSRFSFSSVSRPFHKTAMVTSLVFALSATVATGSVHAQTDPGKATPSSTNTAVASCTITVENVPASEVGQLPVVAGNGKTVEVPASEESGTPEVPAADATGDTTLVPVAQLCATDSMMLVSICDGVTLPVTTTKNVTDTADAVEAPATEGQDASTPEADVPATTEQGTSEQVVVVTADQTGEAVGCGDFDMATSVLTDGEGCFSVVTAAEGSVDPSDATPVAVADETKPGTPTDVQFICEPIDGTVVLSDSVTCVQIADEDGEAATPEADAREVTTDVFTGTCEIIDPATVGTPAP